MNKREILKRIERDDRLSLIEQSQVDLLLSRDDKQQAIAGLLKGLPIEEPSLEWRSRLNERLRHEAQRPLRGFSWLRAGLFASATACAALGAMVIFYTARASSPPVVSSDMLVRWHEEAAASVALPPDGSSMATFAVAEQTPSEKDDVDDLLYGGSMESL